MMSTKKKCATACLAVLIAISAAACSHPNGTSSQSASSQGTSSQSSQKAREEQKQQVKQQEKENKSEYKYKTVTFGYNKNYKEFHADYPEFAQDGTDFSKLNAQIKSLAMQTINSYGTQKGSMAVDVREDTILTYHNKNLISLMFKETVETIPFKGSALDKSKDKTESFVRTFNYDLQSGKEMTMKDLVNVNSTLIQQLQKAAKSDLKKKVSSSLTASAIESALSKGGICFRSDRVEFCLPVSQSLGGRVFLDVKYPDMAAYRTSSTVWNNFTANMKAPQSAKK